jgi:hypothetical protein
MGLAEGLDDPDRLSTEQDPLRIGDAGGRKQQNGNRKPPQPVVIHYRHDGLLLNFLCACLLALSHAR